jgi:tetratricopeptide (TPR) repeat protein
MSPDQWLEAVTDFERKGDWAGLERMCKSKLESDPEYVLALYPLGYALFKQGNYVAAMLYLGKSTREAPTPQAWFTLAHAQHKVDRTKSAIESITKAIELDPEQHELWHDLGTFQAKILNYESALGAFNKAHGLDPKNIATLRNIGFMYVDSDYPDGVRLVKDKIAAISTEEADRFFAEASKAMATNKSGNVR